MRRDGRVLGVLCLLVIGASSANAIEAIVTSAKGNGCKETTFPPHYEREQMEWRCLGPHGFGVRYFDHMTRGTIFLENGARSMSDDSLSWRPADPAIGRHVEWRVENRNPIAAIFGRWRALDSDGSSQEVIVEELLVVKISARQVCAIAVVGGLSPQAMSLARQHADIRARTFRCGIDKPFTNSSASSDAVALLDGRMLKSETLDHNGSSVELNRSWSGAVEIRYTVPKPTLAIPAGTLLFRGSEHNGRLSGQAFIFKDGCSPAGYDVSGGRQNGYLMLEGDAPRRGQGCTINGASKKSGHSRLLFQRDPVLNAGATGIASVATEPSASVPLQRGYYVHADTKCTQASNATLALFNGQSLGYAHTECKQPTVQAISATSYRIVEICRAAQVDNGRWEAVNTNIEVRNRTEFVATTPFGRFHYRHCSQSDLPGPWADVDLAALTDIASEATEDTSTVRNDR